MKISTTALFTAAMLASPFAGLADEARNAPSDTLKTRADRISYATAYQIASDFRRQGWTLHPEALLQGALDASRGQKPALSPSEMRLMLRLLQQRARPASTKTNADKPE